MNTCFVQKKDSAADKSFMLICKTRLHGSKAHNLNLIWKSLFIFQAEEIVEAVLGT